MAWYHQYQFAELNHNLYPTLRGKALPIVQYEITDLPKKIVAVKVKIAPGNFAWFDSKHVTLYKSGSDLIVMPEIKYGESIVRRIMRSFGLKKY